MKTRALLTYIRYHFSGAAQISCIMKCVQRSIWPDSATVHLEHQLISADCVTINVTSFISPQYEKASVEVSFYLNVHPHFSLIETST